ncbi:MAG: hypothetical protein J6T10_20390 [Methanobrevibacter sp.]|nr:hypothetical protein [Methanobrevibacter sp.]
MKRYFKFKNNKHSVIMELLSIDQLTGECQLKNRDYPVYYQALYKDLEYVEDETSK